MATGLVVVKIGGSTLGNHDTTLQDVVALQGQKTPTIVIHGGGKVISQWMAKQGVYPAFIRGLRVTDTSSMEVVTAVLSGLVNKGIVSSLLGLGGRTVGISGVDGGLLHASILDEELGMVGKVESVDPQVLENLLHGGYIPVVAPIAAYGGDEPSRQGVLLNVNADTVAGEIAASVKAQHLVFLTDVEGVLDASHRLIRRVTPQQAARLLESGIIQGGMVPKIEAALLATRGGTVTWIVDGRKPDALLGALEGKGEGTRVG